MLKGLQVENHWDDQKARAQKSATATSIQVLLDDVARFI
jgi:hypothetical protein